MNDEIAQRARFSPFIVPPSSFIVASMEPVRSTTSIVAIACAIGSFVATAQHHAGWGFTLGIVAIVAGALGFLRSVSPRVKGGIISLLSVAMGVIALLV